LKRSSCSISIVFPAQPPRYFIFPVPQKDSQVTVVEFAAAICVVVFELAACFFFIAPSIMSRLTAFLLEYYYAMQLLNFCWFRLLPEFAGTDRIKTTFSLARKRRCGFPSSSVMCSSGLHAFD